MVVSADVGIESVSVEMLVFGEVKVVVLIQEPGISMGSVLVVRVTEVDVVPDLMDILMLQGLN